jgi:hypothetical protein
LTWREVGGSFSDFSNIILLPLLILLSAILIRQLLIMQKIVAGAKVRNKPSIPTRQLEFVARQQAPNFKRVLQLWFVFQTDGDVDGSFDD